MLYSAAPSGATLTNKCHLPKTNMLTSKVADAACPHGRWKSDKIQIVPHTVVAIIIQTGDQLSSVEANRNSNKRYNAEEYFYCVLNGYNNMRMVEVIKETSAPVFLSGLCLHMVK